MYRGSELCNLPSILNSEAKFNNLINTMAWALDLENDGEEGETNVDLVMSKTVTPDLADEEMKEEYETKLNAVYAEYVEKVESLIILFKQEGVPLTLKNMK